jgi:site-specific recombinase XerD
LLKLQGKSQKTIGAYSRAVRRVSDHFNCCPDQLTPEQLEIYFARLVETHSWSTVKVDRNGLQFYWCYVLKLDWQWVNIIKPPKIHTIPDILTPVEIGQLIGATRKLHYRVFLLTTYSMGLRLEDALSPQVGDIDAGRNPVHIRRGKGHKDRLVPLAKYADRALPGHLNAINAIRSCRTPDSGELYVRCPGCNHAEWRPLSCGHRSCPKCQNHQTSQGNDRQQGKLLPVPYFLAALNQAGLSIPKTFPPNG